MSDTLYEQDFFIWTQRQAEELRRAARQGSNLPLDWENLAEEIESLGRRERRELGNLIELIVTHLIKLAASPAELPRRHWTEEVDRFRMSVRAVLDDNPSLKPQLDDLITDAWRGGVLQASIALHHYGEHDAAAPTLALWKPRCLSTAEVLRMGTFPERGTNRMVTLG